MKFLDWVEDMRESCISYALDELFEILDRIAAGDDPMICPSYACSSEALGKLTRMMINNDLLFSQPTAPFSGMSWESLKRVLLPDSPNSPENFFQFRNHDGTSHCPNGVKRYLEPIDKKIETEYMELTGKAWGTFPMPSKE